MKNPTDMTTKELFKLKDQTTQDIDNARDERDMEALAVARKLIKTIDAEISQRVAEGISE